MELKAYLHKVQYYETDQMGVVHHSNYIRWFEESRVDFLDQIGASYDMVEKDGYISPVTSVKCDYKTSVRFGESVYIITKLDKFNGIKFSLTYKVIDSVTKEIKATGESTHCFLNKDGRLISLKKENERYYNLFIEAIGLET
ncbi:acyl-CoA thioester hydrolase [Mobilisporobacter senegalensis]|uniref:Acyl-CoA thioester hydrolase n=1 Tax=Mobilisporobacter senegalensis TaxID=1329262 RepID=A0A3N1XBD2_9FIRM|nr:acyl-CoA thioesterase [Mobilisporobacter senegalensis]ROR23401.1 acyl-CoA thioester hydrolase [Mobilisporobacter senegalensis]